MVGVVKLKNPSLLLGLSHKSKKTAFKWLLAQGWGMIDVFIEEFVGDHELVGDGVLMICQW